MSQVIADKIDEDSDDSDDIEQDFPCEKLTGTILQKVIDYCTHYQQEAMRDIENPLEGETLETIVEPEWYVKFCDVDRDVMFQLVEAANYLNIKPLLDLTCLAVSVSIKGKTLKELKEIFNLPDPA